MSCGCQHRSRRFLVDALFTVEWRRPKKSRRSMFHSISKTRIFSRKRRPPIISYRYCFFEGCIDLQACRWDFNLRPLPRTDLPLPKWLDNFCLLHVNTHLWGAEDNTRLAFRITIFVRSTICAIHSAFATAVDAADDHRTGQASSFSARRDFSPHPTEDGSRSVDDTRGAPSLFLAQSAPNHLRPSPPGKHYWSGRTCPESGK